MGLVVLFFILLYIAVLIGVTIFGYRWGKSQGWPPRKCWRAAAIGFLIIFLPMFGDWLPTVWLHSYYCEQYGGLTVNKSLEQWKKENPGVAETLVRQKPPLQVGAGDKFYLQLNQRFRWEIEHTEKLLWLRQNEDRVMDSKTGEILVRFINFSTGQGGRGIHGFRDMKPWMYRDSCQPPGGNKSGKKFSELMSAYETVGGQ